VKLLEEKLLEEEKLLAVKLLEEKLFPPVSQSDYRLFPCLYLSSWVCSKLCFRVMPLSLPII
jgi:hypothetical protein